ncbi:hypothetical protein BH10CHL1_BH10CHL1_47020 [soil metagenome]
MEEMTVGTGSTTWTKTSLEPHDFLTVTEQVAWPAAPQERIVMLHRMDLGQIRAEHTGALDIQVGA